MIAARFPGALKERLPEDRHRDQDCMGVQYACLSQAGRIDAHVAYNKGQRTWLRRKRLSQIIAAAGCLNRQRPSVSRDTRLKQDSSWGEADDDRSRVKPCVPLSPHRVPGYVLDALCRLSHDSHAFAQAFLGAWQQSLSSATFCLGPFESLPC